MVRASPVMLFGPLGYQSNSYCVLDAVPLLKVVLRARLHELNPKLLFTSHFISPSFSSTMAI